MAFLQRNFFILLIFFSFVPIIWPTGIFQESDWAIFGLWFIAGFYALIFPREVKISPLALGFLFLAAFSLFGVLQNNLTSIGGINEIREGTATSLALAILIVVGRQANMQSLPLWIAPILYGLITVAGCHGLLHLKTYIFLDISAFPMLASIPLYVKFRQSLLRFQYLWDSTYVIAFLFLLKYCDNVAAIIASLCAFIFVFLLPFAKRCMKFLPKQDGLYVIFGLWLIAMMVLVSWNFFSHLIPQLQSRTLLGIVSVFQYFDHFNWSKLFHALFGYGWGSYQEFPVLNLFRLEDFSMYVDGKFNPNWEFLERNLLHTHNLILESFVSSGLLGTGLLLAVIYKWVNNIDIKDWSGRFFVVSYLILLSAWFQTPPVLIFSLFAMVCIQEKDSYQLKLPRFVWVSCGIFLMVFSCVEFWSSISLNKHKFKTIQTFEEDVSAFVNDPAHSYDKWSTYKGSNWTIGWFTQGLNTITKADTKYLLDVEKAIVQITKDYLDSCQKRNVVSSVHVINMCNTFASLQQVRISKDSEFFVNFKKAVLEHIKRFPERSDMAIGFLNICFDKLEDIREVSEIADAILVAFPNHSVGLWFEGLSDLSLGNNKAQAVEKMRQAVNLGLNRYMPVPTELLQELGVQQQANTINKKVKHAIK
ncbi:MAG: hypothetical protein ACK4V2_02465 [Pseudomonadota bacterium]|jgi:hypothetical protein|nr:hypothetical protein [Alphaproteobacteria bacterium]